MLANDSYITHTLQDLTSSWFEFDSSCPTISCTYLVFLAVRSLSRQQESNYTSPSKNKWPITTSKNVGFFRTEFTFQGSFCSRRNSFRGVEWMTPPSRKWRWCLDCCCAVLACNNPPTKCYAFFNSR